MGVRSAAAEQPSCGESGKPQVAGRDSPLGGGVGAEQGLARQGGGPEKKSHPGWAR